MDVGPGILWTVMPLELVMQAGEGAPALTAVWQGDRLVMLRPDGTVERLLSTNPYDYLDPALQPGQPFA
ncbi:MAG TPA: YlzJ-like family protein [Symbiobacteriaceae bacterium]|nr:YlzJ-like family protein [Symbiobacteriaceae bacterium]